MRSFLVIVIFLFLLFGTAGTLTYLIPSPMQLVEASGETTDNCEVFATINGHDKYRCDDFDYSVVCYGEEVGMLWCLPKL